jgi:hypothetical protein
LHTAILRQLARSSKAARFLHATKPLLRRSRGQKSQPEATWTFRDHCLFFNFKVLIDVFAFNAQFASAIAIGTGDTFETHG